MNFINWFKFNIKRYFQLDESENSNYDIFALVITSGILLATGILSNITTLTNLSAILALSVAVINIFFKVQENSNQFF